MSTTTLGMGFSPLGFSLFGYGSPATGSFDQGYTLQEVPNGTSGDARIIDPYTRDYIIDEDGVVKGQSAIAQQVFLAVVTTLGSSVNPNLGSKFSDVRTFDQRTFQAKMIGIVQQCLAALINDGSVTLVSVQAAQNTNRVAGNITINWIDNVSQQLNQTTV